MTSLQSGFATPVRMPSKFVNIITPNYRDSSLNNLEAPIPFTVVNQTLDIQITNSSVQNLVNNGTSPEANGESSEFHVKLMGGRKLITSLGPTMITYLRNLINSQDSLGAPYDGELVIYIKPVMTKVQAAQPGNVTALVRGNNFGINDQPPTSDEYIGGEDSNNYYTSWVFYSPLTVRYVSPASTTGYRYITFNTDFSEE